MKSQILFWISHCIDLNDFITHFTGFFQAVAYDSPFPHPKIFNNAQNYKYQVDFIAKDLKHRLLVGATNFVGRVGEVAPLKYSLTHHYLTHKAKMMY